MRYTRLFLVLLLAAGCSDSEVASPQPTAGSSDGTAGFDPSTNASFVTDETSTPTTAGTAGAVDPGTGPSTAGTANAGRTTTGEVSDAGQTTLPNDAGGSPIDAGGTPIDSGESPSLVDANGSPNDAGAPVDSGGPPEPQTCPAGATGRAGRSVETVQVGGVNRSYILYVPNSYTGDVPIPLMVNFHPLLTNATIAEGSSGYKQLADREGFIVAFPDSIADAAWNLGGTCCTRNPNVDDVGFARALVQQVQSNYCVDKKRVYATGFSMGAGMAHYLACEAADVFAAVATGHFDLLGENPCTPARPITVFSYRSTADVVVPYAGGLHTTAPNGFVGNHTLLGAVGTFERWAELNGCTGQPVSNGFCQTYEQCSEGVKVTLCTVAGGHIFPDAAGSWAGISDFSLP